MIWSPILGLGQIGLWQLVLLFAIVLLLFGAKRLPKLARGMGASITEFKKGLNAGGTTLDQSGQTTGRDVGTREVD